MINLDALVPSGPNFFACTSPSSGDYSSKIEQTPSNSTNRDSSLELMSSSEKPAGKVTGALDTDDLGGSSTDGPGSSSLSGRLK